VVQIIATQFSRAVEISVISQRQPHLRIIIIYDVKIDQGRQRAIGCHFENRSIAIPIRAAANRRAVKIAIITENE
jgi:hypothetical protein